MKNKITTWFLWIFILLSLFVLIYFNLSIKACQQFTLLAQSFLQGKLHFTPTSEVISDTALFNGKYFWPLGPFPAVILMPFVWIFSRFGYFFYQGYLQVFLVVITFYLVYKISEKYKYSPSASLFLAYGFLFATAYIGVAIKPWSWYFAQIVATTLIFWAIYEFLNSKRYLLLGFISGSLLLTRATGSLLIILFILDILFASNDIFKDKFSNLIKLFTPFAVSLILLFTYNLIRFNNILEQGYSYQILAEGATLRKSYGLFSIKHLPGNLYYFLLSVPTPVFKDNLSHVLTSPFVKSNPWGLSIFITSPIFLYLFLLNHRDKLSQFLIITSVSIAIPVFLYYGIGYNQFGYRYSLDFLPLLFTLLMKNYHQVNKNLSLAFRLIILISSWFNLYLLFTIHV